jgi:ectoine hydroxylase-related dioxygenase (phytanoyl-CoA dioxygenase family)
MKRHFELKGNGIAMAYGLFSSQELFQLDHAANHIEAIGRSKGGGRNILSLMPNLLPIFKKPEIISLISNLVGEVSGLSEGIYLNKSEEANWLVAWHQDLFISVKNKVESVGYGPWSIKDAQPYVQPPVEVLNKSLWLRINLDDNGEDNGCLRVIPGSHEKGKLSEEDISQMQSNEMDVALPCKRGESILFRPLLLHKSAKSEKPKARRVFQVLYSGYAFQNGLEWPF